MGKVADAICKTQRRYCESCKLERQKEKEPPSYRKFFMEQQLREREVLSPQLVYPKIRFIRVEEQSNTYHFRGDINLEKIVRDCVKDGKVGFVAVGPDDTYSGTLYTGHIPFEGVMIHPFFVTKHDKSETSQAIKRVQNFCKEYYKESEKQTRKINRNKARGFTQNLPKTKVMVF